MTHTASHRNPADALAQMGRESRRAYEHDWHIWTEQEISAYSLRWGVRRDLAARLLNFQMLEASAGRNVDLVNLGELAQRLDEWGEERWQEGEMAERERYQDRGD